MRFPICCGKPRREEKVATPAARVERTSPCQERRAVPRSVANESGRAGSQALTTSPSLRSSQEVSPVSSLMLRQGLDLRRESRHTSRQEVTAMREPGRVLNSSGARGAARGRYGVEIGGVHGWGVQRTHVQTIINEARDGTGGTVSINGDDVTGIGNSVTVSMGGQGLVAVAQGATVPISAGSGRNYTESGEGRLDVTVPIVNMFAPFFAALQREGESALRRAGAELLSAEFPEETLEALGSESAKLAHLDLSQCFTRGTRDGYRDASMGRCWQPSSGMTTVKEDYYRRGYRAGQETYEAYS